MKTKLYTITILLSLIALSSCENFLDENPGGKIQVKKFYNNYTEANSALNGVYSILNLDAGNNFFYINELPTDDGYLFVSEQLPPPERFKMEQIMFSSDISYFQIAWSRYYSVINRANDVIAGIKYDRTYDTITSVVGAHRKMFEIEAQARYLRAYSYFCLVRWFGDVPLISEPTQAGTTQFYPQRSPQSVVYDKIIEDLKFAQLWLNKEMYPYSDTNNGGRVTQAAAIVCLSKVYMTLAGRQYYSNYSPEFPLEPAQTDMINKALSLLKPLIDMPSSFGVDFMDSYADIFDVTKKAGNKEAIFYLQGAGDVTSFTGMHGFFWKWNGGLHPSREVFEQYDIFDVAKMNYTWEDGSVSQELSRDDRFNVTFGTLLSTGGVQTKGPANPGMSSNLVYISKWTDFAYSETSRNDLIIYRYSDVLLMYAELLAVQNNITNLPKIKELLKKIKQAHSKFLESEVDNMLAPITDCNAAFEEIKLERRRELMFEGHRRFDLLRWGNYTSRMIESLASQFSKPQSEYSGRINSYYNLFPIPLREFVVNPNLGDQNPGYSK
jgi:hypothetical protein